MNMRFKYSDPQWTELKKHIEPGTIMYTGNTMNFMVKLDEYDAYTKTCIKAGIEPREADAFNSQRAFYCIPYEDIIEE